jgi:TRAP-type C4-dicarboxylate transport system permease large subunit
VTPLILGASAGPLVFLLLVNVMLLIIGRFMEALAAMLILILIPILAPAAASYGIDPLHGARHPAVATADVVAS